jgi:hypothetical protein
LKVAFAVTGSTRIGQGSSGIVPIARSALGGVEGPNLGMNSSSWVGYQAGGYPWIPRGFGNYLL